MKPSEALERHRDGVLKAAMRIGAHNIRVFGSVSRGEDTNASDLDLLVDVPRGVTLLDMVRLQDAIATELGVAVDVLTANDIPVRFRKQVIQEATPL